jgi:hypothetical protein
LRSFLAIKRCQRTKNKKVIKLARSSLKSWAHICAHRGKAVKEACWTLAPPSSGIEAVHISCPIPAEPRIILFWLLQNHGSSSSGLSSNTDHPVLPPPPNRCVVPRLTSSQARDTVVLVKKASWTLAPLSSGIEAFHISPCRATDRTVLVAPELWIIRFWPLKQHGSSGSAPTPS